METDKLTQPAYAAALNGRFAARYADLSVAKPDDPVAWAWETHAIAESGAYANLEPGIPVATPDTQAVCGPERDKTAALHIAIGEAYLKTAMPVIEERLAVGGIRLAILLNAALR